MNHAFLARRSTDLSNRFCDRPIKAMDRDTDIGQNRIELRGTVERLDPSANGKLLSKRGFLDKIFGSKISNYFAQYRSAKAAKRFLGKADRKSTRLNSSH